MLTPSMDRVGCSLWHVRKCVRVVSARWRCLVVAGATLGNAVQPEASASTACSSVHGKRSLYCAPTSRVTRLSSASCVRGWLLRLGRRGAEQRSPHGSRAVGSPTPAPSLPRETRVPAETLRQFIGSPRGSRWKKLLEQSGIQRRQHGQTLLTRAQCHAVLARWYGDLGEFRLRRWRCA